MNERKKERQKADCIPITFVGSAVSTASCFWRCCRWTTLTLRRTPRACVRRSRAWAPMKTASTVCSLQCANGCLAWMTGHQPYYTLSPSFLSLSLSLSFFLSFSFSLSFSLCLHSIVCALTEIVSGRTNKQRQMIREAYNSMYKRDLLKVGTQIQIKSLFP
jgi:hypothetical protein